MLKRRLRRLWRRDERQGWGPDRSSSPARAWGPVLRDLRGRLPTGTSGTARRSPSDPRRQWGG